MRQWRRNTIMIWFFAFWLVIPAGFAGLGMAKAQNMPLPPPVIARIQQQFQGRVVGVIPSTPAGRECKEFSKEVLMGGRKETVFGTACLQPDGSWGIENNYDVQVLTAQGRMVIVTVDPATGKVMGVRN